MFIKFYSIIHKLLLSVVYRMKIPGLLYRSHISISKDNRILSLGSLTHSQLVIKGKGNSINIRGTLFGSIIRVEGDNCEVLIEPGVMIYDSFFLLRGHNAIIHIGDNTRIQSKCRFICQGDNNFIKVAANCLFSDGVSLWNSDTHTIFDKFGSVANPSKPIIIGEHVWLGSNCSVLKGVSVGNDCVIGLQSVVTKSIENNTVVAGNPAKVIKNNIKWDKQYVNEVQL